MVCVLSTPPKELIKFIKDNKILGVNQNNPCGTADAVKSALKKIPDRPNNKILILYGDVPFISTKSLNIMINKLDKSDLCIGTFNQVNPTGYGRIVREDNKIRRIIEEKDANDKTKKSKRLIQVSFVLKKVF